MRLYFLIITLLIILSFSAKAEELVCNATQCDAGCTICTTEPAVLVCSANQCDAGCVLCSDNKCHDPGFTCEADLNIESITPEELDIGKNQLNILVRNTGNVDLKNVYAEVSGNGISMVDNDEIESLVVDDKDYAFVRIIAEKAGKVDLAIKLYSNSELIKKDVQQITIVGEEQKVETLNKTEVENTLNQLKERHKQIEQDYQTKKNEGYPVDEVFDNLKSASTYLKDANFYLLDGDLKKTDINTKLAEESLNDVEDGLKNLKKAEKTLGEKIKANLVYISSIAAAIITLLTAYKLTTNYVNKKNLVELHQKVKEKGTALQQKIRSSDIISRKIPQEKKKKGSKKKKSEKKEEAKEEIPSEET